MNFLRRFIVSQRPGFSSLSRTRLRNVPTFRSYSSAEKGSDAGETKVNDNPSEALDANKSLAEKEAKITELSDSYLRLLADMENLRTRTKREIESAGQFAITKFSKDIIGVADVLEMALKSVDPEHPLLTGNAAEKAEADSDAEAVPELKNNVNADPKLAQLVQGIEMTLEEVRKVLMKHGILPILPLHQKFDPNLHNALFQVPTGDVEPGTVVNVIKRGYLLHHRVLRAADVGVSKAP